jgi:hypothetical protein
MAAAGTDVTGYTVSNPVLMLDTYTLADSILSKLNEISANNSLEIEFPTHTHLSTSTTSTKILADIKDSVSRANFAMMKSRDPAIIVDDTADSFASVANDMSSFRWKYGSQYFPNSEMKIDDVGSYKAMYAWFLQQTGKFGDAGIHSGSAVHYTGFTDAPTASGAECIYEGGHACVVVDLERNHVLGGSGLKINGSRMLTLDVTLANADTLQNDIFLEYNRLVRVWLNKVQVDL